MVKDHLRYGFDRDTEGLRGVNRVSGKVVKSRKVRLNVAIAIPVLRGT